MPCRCRGCYVQSDSEGVQKDEAVDLVLGNNCKINIVEALENYAADHDSYQCTGFIGKTAL